MGRSHPASFAKRAREAAKRAKRQEKADKRAQRRVTGEGDEQESGPPIEPLDDRDLAPPRERTTAD